MKLTDISRQLATAFAAVGVSGLVLVGCSNSSAPEATKEPVTEGATAETAASDIDPDHTKIVIGTTEGDFADMVRNQVKGTLEAQGYEVELIAFTDYVRPNLHWLKAIWISTFSSISLILIPSKKKTTLIWLKYSKYQRLHLASTQVKRLALTLHSKA